MENVGSGSEYQKGKKKLPNSVTLHYNILQGKCYPNRNGFILMF